MKLKAKNVLIVFSDDSIIKGIEMGELVDRDGCLVEVCKHGVEFVHADDFAAYTERDYEAVVAELHAKIAELTGEIEVLSSAIMEQQDYIDELSAEVDAVTEASEANLVEDYDLDAELADAEDELFSEWFHEAFFDGVGG